MAAPAVAVALVGGLLLASTIDDDPAPETGATRLATSVDRLGSPLPLAPGESVLESVVRADGSVVVEQWIHAGEPLQELRLVLPDVTTRTEVSASAVEVLAGGTPVDGPTEIGARGATYAFAPTTTLRLRYRIDGVVQRSDPATGRALAVATTLDVDYAPRTARETRLLRADGGVLSVACAAPGETSPSPCGSATGRRWRVDLVDADVTDRVVAQLDLGPAVR